MKSSQEQSIALTSQVKAIKRAAIKPPSDHSKKTGGGKCSHPKDTDAAKDAAKKGVKGSGAPKWQITHQGATMKHPNNGKDMVWCSHHVSQDGKVNGTYMFSPHNHNE